MSFHSSWAFARSATTAYLEALEPRHLLSVDLVGTVGLTTVPGPVVPGDCITLNVRVANQGDQLAAGRMAINYYISPTARIADAVQTVVLADQSVKLAPGGAKVFKTKFVVPSTIPAGDYYILADIDPAHAIAGESSANNLAVSSQQREVTYQFGTVPGRLKPTKMILTEADGSAATLSLNGPGVGEVTLSGGRWNITLAGTDVTSAFTIAVKGGDGKFALGAIRGADGTESLKSISAKSVNLTGAGVELGGSLGGMTIRDLIGGADVFAGGVPAQKSKITVHEIGNGTTIEIGSTISSLSAARIGIADIFAPSIAGITTKGDRLLAMPGDFSADVTISGDGVAAGKPALGKLTIGGMFRDGLVLVNGSVGSVKAASMAQNVATSFGIDAKSVKSAAIGSPIFAWNAKGATDQSAGNFHVIAEARPGAWPLKDAAWDLDAPGRVDTVTWQNSNGQTIKSEAVLGEVQISIDPWRTSRERVEKLALASGGDLLAQLPSAGLYWASVDVGEEAAFISDLADAAVSTYPNFVTSARDIGIPTNWAEIESAVIPGISGMGTGNIDLEGHEPPLAVTTIAGFDAYIKITNGTIVVANGHFVTTLNPAEGATHVDLVNYYRTDGGKLYAAEPTITATNSTVAIPETTKVDANGNQIVVASTLCDMASVAAAIQRASELGQDATINLSWGNPEYKPYGADPVPVGWETYNQSNAAVYLASLESVLESHVKGAGDAIVVQAAGNGMTDLSTVLVNQMTLHPTAASQIIEVGAIDASGHIASYSNYSSTAGTMVYVPVTDTTDVGSDLPGTSFAAPKLQFLVSQIRKNRPDLTPAEIRQIIFDPSVSPRRLVDRPGGVGTITIPVIENPYAPKVLTDALALAETKFPRRGFTVTPSEGLQTSEEGDTDSFTVVLKTKPTANVTIKLSSSDPTEGKVSKSSLVFTPANWSTPQLITVTGVNDSVADGNQTYSIITKPAASVDPGYSGLDAADVDVTNQDDEEPPAVPVSITLELSAQRTGWQLGSRAGFAMTASGTAAGPEGTRIDLDAFTGATAYSPDNPYWPHTFVMDAWTGLDANGYYRAVGDPPTTHFSWTWNTTATVPSTYQFWIGIDYRIDYTLDHAEAEPTITLQ